MFVRILRSPGFFVMVAMLVSFGVLTAVGIASCREGEPVVIEREPAMIHSP